MAHNFKIGARVEYIGTTFWRRDELKDHPIYITGTADSEGYIVGIPTLGLTGQYFYTRNIRLWGLTNLQDLLQRMREHDPAK